MKPKELCCMNCSISDSCPSILIPEEEDTGIAPINPWHCRHITCPIGEIHAIRAIKRNPNNSSEPIKFNSPQKRVFSRRVDPSTGAIQSLRFLNTPFSWTFTGQVVDIKKIK